MFLKTEMKVEWIQYLYDLKKMTSSVQRCIKKCLRYCFLDTPKKNQGGVNNYQHFRKDFVYSYGLAHSRIALTLPWSTALNHLVVNSL